MTDPAQRGARAFTLVELLAVLVIIALVLGITLPNLSLRSDRVMLGSAEDLAARLSFARQRAVATGSPHRVVVDLDTSAWWIEVPPEQASEFAVEPPPAPGAPLEVRLTAPLDAGRQFAPLAGPFGRPRQLPADVFFASVETLAAGPVAAGQVGIVFEEDGTADPALFLLQNEEGIVVSVRIARLADEVEIRRE
jgi:prepilin-type N-terminal cleavage/methylation domain-containing protein